MKLQLALDLVNIPEAIELIKEVEASIDVVEIGTPVVINEGLRAVKEVKQAFPNLRVLADLKIMDAAGYEVQHKIRGWSGYCDHSCGGRRYVHSRSGEGSKSKRETNFSRYDWYQRYRRPCERA